MFSYVISPPSEKNEEESGIQRNSKVVCCLVSLGNLTLKWKEARKEGKKKKTIDREIEQWVFHFLCKGL